MVSLLCVTFLSILAFFVLDPINALNAFFVRLSEATSLTKHRVEF